MFDENKFESIVNEYRQNVRKYCLNKLAKDHFAAEEVTDDVFVIMYKKWDTLYITDIKAWLYRTADYCIRNHFRKRRVNVSIDDFTEKSLPDELTTRDYEYKVIYQIYIDAIIGKLDKEEQSIFRLRYIENLTLEEISKEIGMPYSTVRFRLANISNRIKRQLQESGHK